MDILNVYLYQGHSGKELYAEIGIPEYFLCDVDRRYLPTPLIGFRLVDGEYEPIEISPNEHGLESGYSEVLRLRMCSLERSRLSEMESIQPGMMLEDDYNRARLLLQDADTGLYLLGTRARFAQAERADSERERAETRANLAETRANLAEIRAERT